MNLNLNGSITAAIALLAFGPVACLKKPNASAVAARATANSLKTGFFMPVHSATAMSLLPPKAISAADLAAKIGIAVEAKAGRETYVATTAEGDQILLETQGLSYPVPLGILHKNGQVSVYVAPGSRTVKDKGIALSGIFYQVGAGDKAEPFVSSDGNQTNIYLVHNVQNDFGTLEPYLISYLSELVTPSNRRIFKVGNSVVDAVSGKSVLEFREAGNQVWRVHGIYSDQYLTLGSIIWSPDLVTYYSKRTATAAVNKWRKQDDNSMDFLGAAPTNIAVPAIVTRLLQNQPSEADMKTLAHFGPVAGTAATGATSLAKIQRSGAPLGLALAGQQQAPSPENAEAYDAFFELQPKSAGFALDQNALSYSPKGQYPQGKNLNFTLGNQIYSGQTLIPTVSTTQPGGWFSSGSVATKTYVGIGNGQVAELNGSTASRTPDIRFLNGADLSNMAAAANAPALDQQKASLTTKFQQQVADAQETAVARDKLADDFKSDYGTTNGILRNVVVSTAVDMATAGGSKFIADKAGLNEAGNEALTTAIDYNFKVAGDVTTALASGSPEGAGTAVLGKTTELGATLIAGGTAGKLLGPLASGTAEFASADSNAEGIRAIGRAGADTVGNFVPLPGLSTAIKVSSDGLTSIGTSAYNQSQFQGASNTADQINMIDNNRSNYNSLLNAYSSQPQLAPETKAPTEAYSPEGVPAESSSLPTEAAPLEEPPSVE